MEPPFGRLGSPSERPPGSARIQLSARELQAFVDNMPEARSLPARPKLGPADRNLETTDERPRQPVDKLRVHVRACGRLEAIHLEAPGSVSELVVAARRSFEFPAGQDLVLTDGQGQQIGDDIALRTSVAIGEAVCVRLSDNALHDFERQIDQLEHMRIGYLCDQFAVMRQEQAELLGELRGLHAAVEAEQRSRELAAEAARREIDDIRSLSHRQFQGGDDQLEALEAAVFHVKNGLQEEALARESVSHDSHRKFQDLRDAITAESKAREYGDERLRLESEELRRALQLEVADREDAGVRWESTIRDVREAVGKSADGTASDAVDIRQQLVAVKQAVAVEQRERISADSDLVVTFKEFRGHLQDMLRERATGETRLLARCSDMETTLDAERLENQQAVTALTHHLSVVVESIQEEQSLRAAEDNDLTSSMEAVHRMVDEVRRKIDEAELSITRISHEMVKRLDEEVRTRRESESKVGRTLAGLQETFNDGSDRQVRELEQRIDNCRAGIEVEQRDRMESLQELSQRLLQQRQAMSEEQQSRSATLEELSTRVTQQGAELRKERQERAAVDAELAVALQEARELIDQESTGREKDLTATRTAMEEGMMEHVRLQYSDLISSDITGIREGIAKVVEAVQQERRARSDADNKLREDIRQALEKEVRARQEQDTEIREDIERETEARQEVVELIQSAIEELRTELEEDGEEWQDTAGPTEYKVR